MTKVVTITIRDSEFVVTGDYFAGTPDVWYLKNGDPGYPGESETFEIESISCDGVEISQIIESMNCVMNSSVKGQFGKHPNEDLWTFIEQECLRELTK